MLADRDETGLKGRYESIGTSGQSRPSDTLKRECPEDTVNDEEDVNRARKSAEPVNDVPNTTELRADDYQSSLLNQEYEEQDLIQAQLAQVKHQVKGYSQDPGSSNFGSLAALLMETKPKVQQHNLPDTSDDT